MPVDFLSMIKDKRVLVTGGAGFIGSNLVYELSKEEHANEVIVVDNLSTGNIKNIHDLVENDKIEFIRGSITNLNLMKKASKNVDFVFHLAAFVSVPKSIKEPLTANKVNVVGTLNVLLSALDNDVKKVVFSSSCAIYGDPPKDQLPIKETVPSDPLSPYSNSKLLGEYYCNVFTKSYNLPTVSFRYFNVYGPRQNPAGEYAAVIPKFIIRIKDKKPPIIYGDGKQTRDFIFVNDVVKANILAAQNKSNGVFNIASGVETSISELSDKIMEKMEKRLKPVYKNERYGDIKQSYADILKAKRELNFNPSYSLDEGLESTIKYFIKNIKK